MRGADVSTAGALGSAGEVVDVTVKEGSVAADAGVGVFCRSAGGGKRWKKRNNRGGSDLASCNCCVVLILGL